jgi:beta-N-acetylhexosaminidase
VARPYAQRPAPPASLDAVSTRPRTSTSSTGQRALAGTALAVLTLAACAGVDVPGSSTAAPARKSAPPTPTCEPAPLEARAAAVIHLGLPDVTSADDPLVAEVLEVGLGGLFIDKSNVESRRQVTDLITGIREQAGSRPLLISTDEESGRVSDLRELIGNTASPRRLAAQREPEQVRAYAAELGQQMRELGFDVNLAPLLDLDDGPSAGIVGDRSFSADPDAAATYGLAFSSGMADAGIVPTVKHFPGHGRSATDTHAVSDVVDASLEELRETDLAPFQEAVDQGAPVVMLNHLAYEVLDPDLPATMSPKAYELLRDMGFDGVAMTDSIGMGSIYPRWDFPDAAVAAIAAGADVVLGSGAVLRVNPDAAREMRDALVDAVRDGSLPEERLDEAAARATALAGGDPVAMACVDKTAARLGPDPAEQPAAGAGPSGPAAPTTRTGTASPAPTRTP